MISNHVGAKYGVVMAVTLTIVFLVAMRVTMGECADGNCSCGGVSDCGHSGDEDIIIADKGD